MLKYLVILIWLFATAPVTFAQTATATTEQNSAGTESPEVEMADVLRRDGKIYVVVAVIVTVLAGVFFYLIRLDRKVNKLEQQFKS